MMTSRRITEYYQAPTPATSLQGLRLPTISEAGSGPGSTPHPDAQHRQIHQPMFFFRRTAMAVAAGRCRGRCRRGWCSVPETLYKLRADVNHRARPPCICTVA